jgi:hypothetical protein
MPGIPPLWGKPAILPPFTTAPPAERSPYKTTIEEVIERFGTSSRRREILRGLLTLRRKLRRLGMGAQFQWLAGSFVEEIEREPGDVDVVTFYKSTADDLQRWQNDPSLTALFAEVMERKYVKATYHCDNFFVSLNAKAPLLVSQTHYWYGLYSHQKNTQVWKGILDVEVTSADDDQGAETLLTGSP